MLRHAKDPIQLILDDRTIRIYFAGRPQNILKLKLSRIKNFNSANTWQFSCN